MSDKPKEFDEVFTKKEAAVKPSEVIEGITEDAATEITKTKGQLEKDFWKAFNKLASQDEYKINGEAWKRRPITRKEHREVLSLRRQLEKLDKNQDTEAFLDLEETIYKKFAHYCLVKKDTGIQMSEEEFDNSENEILQRVLDAIFYKLEAGLPFVQQASKTY
jgi:hypothetical protein